MNKLTTLTLSLTALVGCITGDNQAPAADEPDPVVTPRLYPQTCAELAKQDPALQDGEHRLYINHEVAKPWRAYCADMQSAPVEYLTLAAVGAGTWSQFRAGGRATGTDVETRFDKVRIDPISLKLDVSDVTFAVSTGSLTDPNGAAITSMPLGIAKSCGGGYATANVDLGDTPFFLVDRSFAVAGDAGATGHAELWESGQVMEMWADGDCGWVAPMATNAVSLTYGK